jgi:hypothetical protein
VRSFARATREIERAVSRIRLLDPPREVPVPMPVRVIEAKPVIPRPAAASRAGRYNTLKHRIATLETEIGRLKIQCRILAEMIEGRQRKQPEQGMRLNVPEIWREARGR